jgi:hypothetical protein
MKDEMNEQNNGGPAFPAPAGVSHITEQGMTLRDYFAAQVMPEIVQRVEAGGFERVAKLCYEMADAMLKARAA